MTSSMQEAKMTSSRMERRKRVAGCAEKFVGLGAGEPQRECELDCSALRDGPVRVRDDGGPCAAVDPGRVVRERRIAMALALDMACEQIGESSLAGDGCWRSGGVHCRTSFLTSDGKQDSGRLRPGT